MKPIDMTLGEQIACWREYRKLTQEQVAKLATCAPLTIRRAERGDSVTMDTAHKIATALNVTLVINPRGQ